MIKKIYILLFISFCLQVNLYAQEAETKQAFHSKVSELYTKYKLDGFVTYKGADLNMQKNTEFPIWVDLKEGRWYQFCVIGDPEATKFEMKLAKEEVGNIVTDKFKNAKTNEYWTQFSFICPRSGRYLLTFYQRGPRKELLGHVAILQRPAKTTEGQTVSYSLK
jgi:hypothetical protein